MAGLIEYLTGGLYSGVGSTLYLSGGLLVDGAQGPTFGGGASPVVEALEGTVEAILSGIEYPDVASVRAQQLAVRWDLPASRQSVILADTLYEVQLVYRRRSVSWYLSLWDLDGNLVAGGRRLTPGWAVNLGMVDGPDGLLLVTGPEDYRRDDLGTRLRLTFYPRTDVEQPVPDFADTLVVFG